eukprot:scpid51627/ scgid19729/ 
MGPQLRISTRILLVLMIFGFGLIAMHDDRTVRHLMRAVRDEAEWQQHGKDAANTAKVFTREVNANYRPLLYDLNSEFMERTSPSTGNDTNLSLGSDGVARPSYTQGYGKAHRLMAVASFSMDQLVVGCNQFATFVMAGVAWDRDVVIPKIQGSHYTGLAGSQDVKLDRRYSKSNSSLPRKMDDYFNLEHISNHLEKHHLKLVPQAEALELCKGQWSILYLIPSTEAKHSIYGFLSESRTESFRNSWQSTMKKLKGSGDPRLAIETDCDWITEGMPKDVRQLAPFSRVICAAIPSRFTWQWKLSKAAKLVSDVSSRCLLISHWFGPHRHGFRRPKKPPAVWFSAARRIQDTAQRAVGRSSLSKGFTVLHVRSEYIFNRCRPSDNPPFYCQRRNVSFQTYFKQCADLVLRTIASHPRNQSVLMAFDLRSEGMKLKRKQALLQPIQTMQYMLNRLKEQFTKVITLEDFVARHIRGTANRDIVSNNGMRALLDAEILTQASPFVAVGGGHFQGRMLEQVKDNGTLIECHNIM